VSGLALLYFYEQKYERGKSFAQRSLPIQEKTLGPESLPVSTTLNRLGICERELKQFPQAEASLKRALAIREKRLPPNHNWIVISLENLGSVYLCEGQPEKAVPLALRLKTIEDAKTVAAR
jgi:tetratricopeptide (TPR) repeat protein